MHFTYLFSLEANYFTGTDYGFTLKKPIVLYVTYGYSCCSSQLKYTSNNLQGHVDQCCITEQLLRMLYTELFGNLNLTTYIWRS